MDDFARAVTAPGGLRAAFGAGDARIAFRMGPDGVASTIPGLGITAAPVANADGPAGGLNIA